jgi:non-heme chloroperoxidase
MFEYQFTELPDHGYGCIGRDIRGFESDKPWDGYNYDATLAGFLWVVICLTLQG